MKLGSGRVGSSGSRMSGTEGKGMVKDSRAQPTLGYVGPWGTGQRQRGQRVKGMGVGRGMRCGDTWEQPQRSPRPWPRAGLAQMRGEAGANRGQAGVPRAVPGRGGRDGELLGRRGQNWDGVGSKGETFFWLWRYCLLAVDHVEAARDAWKSIKSSGAGTGSWGLSRGKGGSPYPSCWKGNSGRLWSLGF